MSNKVADFDTEFELQDVYEDEKTIEGKLSVSPRGVMISFSGYEDYQGADNILIEFADGEPKVVIWGDSKKEDPNHVISLAWAKVGELPEDQIT
jgi:hypothetical protein